MNEMEWQTYLALQQSGLAQPPQAEQLLEDPPWESGEVKQDRGVDLSPHVQAFSSLAQRRLSTNDLTYMMDVAPLRLLLALSLARPAERPRSRPYPTSGGLDELGILIAARSVDGLPEGAYWASAGEEHTFRRAASLNGAYEEFEQQACPYLGLAPASPPAAFLLVFADWRTLAARYVQCVLSSGLMDSGALLQTLSLAAGAVGLNACICACIQPVLIERWLKLACREIGHIGTMALGGQPAGVNYLDTRGASLEKSK